MAGTPVEDLISILKEFWGDNITIHAIKDGEQITSMKLTMGDKTLEFGSKDNLVQDEDVHRITKFLANSTSRTEGDNEGDNNATTARIAIAELATPMNVDEQGEERVVVSRHFQGMSGHRRPNGDIELQNGHGRRLGTIAADASVAAARDQILLAATEEAASDLSNSNHQLDPKSEMFGALAKTVSDDVDYTLDNNVVMRSEDRPSDEDLVTTKTKLYGKAAQKTVDIYRDQLRRKGMTETTPVTIQVVAARAALDGEQFDYYKDSNGDIIFYQESSDGVDYPLRFIARSSANDNNATEISNVNLRAVKDSYSEEDWSVIIIESNLPNFSEQDTQLIDASEFGDDAIEANQKEFEEDSDAEESEDDHPNHH